MLGLLRKRTFQHAERTHMQPIKVHTMQQLKRGTIDRVVIGNKSIIEYTSIRVDNGITIVIKHGEYVDLNETDFCEFETSIPEYFSI
jgi:hypothetical protein